VIMARASPFASLLILFLGLCVLAAVGYVVYVIVRDITNQVEKTMEKKHISFGKEGMKVGVKEKTAEQTADKTQRLELNVIQSRLGLLTHC